MLKDHLQNTTDAHAMAKSLEELAKQHGCKIKVIDFGSKAPHFEDHKLNEISQALNDFLAAPTIKDEFGHEHHLRRKFHAVVEINNPKLFVWYQTNRLRYNNILGLSYITLAFDKTLQDYPDANHIFSEMVKAMPQTAEAFNALSDEEKIRTTNTIARAIKMGLSKLKI